jgi:hypothetical protein
VRDFTEETRELELIYFEEAKPLNVETKFGATVCVELRYPKLARPARVETI